MIERAAKGGYEAVTWQRKVQLLSEIGETRRAIDLVFGHFNSLIRARDFDECNDVLEALDVDSINSTLMVAFLSITLPVKNLLWARRHFFARVWRNLLNDRGEERTSRLLNKYE